MNFFVGKFCHLGHIERAERYLRAPHRLHDCHFKARAYCHYFAGSLHSRAEISLGIEEFIEGPLGKLNYDVVERRLEAGKRLARDVVSDFVEGVAERNLCGNLCYGVARSLGSERRRTRNTGINLYYRILERVGMKRKLTVTAALYSEFGYDVERCRSEHLIFLVGERYRRRYDYGVARMYADGVKVFHGADGEHVACAVPEHFELYLLPAADILFDEYLRYGRKHKSVVRYEL